MADVQPTSAGSKWLYGPCDKALYRYPIKRRETVIWQWSARLPVINNEQTKIDNTVDGTTNE